MKISEMIRQGDAKDLTRMPFESIKKDLKQDLDRAFKEVSQLAKQKVIKRHLETLNIYPLPYEKMTKALRYFDEAYNKAKSAKDITKGLDLSLSQIGMDMYAVESGIKDLATSKNKSHANLWQQKKSVFQSLLSDLRTLIRKYNDKVDRFKRVIQ